MSLEISIVRLTITPDQCLDENYKLLYISTELLLNRRALATDYSLLSSYSDYEIQREEESLRCTCYTKLDISFNDEIRCIAEEELSRGSIVLKVTCVFMKDLQEDAEMACSSRGFTGSCSIQVARSSSEPLKYDRVVTMRGGGIKGKLCMQISSSCLSISPSPCTDALPNPLVYSSVTAKGLFSSAVGQSQAALLPDIIDKIYALAPLHAHHKSIDSFLSSEEKSMLLK
jgi:hypothetical protein